MPSSRHPILADTSALIALGMSRHWDVARNSLRISTTNICLAELKKHVRVTSDYAIEGTREYRLHHGSKRALGALEDDSCAFETVIVHGASRGSDGGEASLKKEVGRNPSPYQYVVLNDSRGRDALRRVRAREDFTYQVVPPTYLLYVLYDQQTLSKPEFCEGCEDMMKGEGWTNAGAIYAMWEQIPVDCTGHVDPDLLP